MGFKHSKPEQGNIESGEQELVECISYQILLITLKGTHYT